MMDGRNVGEWFLLTHPIFCLTSRRWTAGIRVAAAGCVRAGEIWWMHLSLNLELVYFFFFSQPQLVVTVGGSEGPAKDLLSGEEFSAMRCWRRLYVVCVYPPKCG